MAIARSSSASMSVAARSRSSSWTATNTSSPATWRRRQPDPGRCRHGVIVAVVERALTASETTLDDVAAVGVQRVPGRVDPLSGSVTLAVNLGASNLHLGPQLESRFGRQPSSRTTSAPPPSVFIADASSATSMTWPTSRSGPVCRPVSCSTAASIAARAGWPAESATSSPSPEGRRCACGERGCLETLVSGFRDRPPGTRGHRRRPADPSMTATAATPTAPNAVDVYHAAAGGDPLAMEIAETVGRRLAWAVHLLVMTYDVERVVLGGGVSHAGETFAQPIIEIDQLRATSALALEQLRPRDRGPAARGRRCRSVEHGDDPGNAVEVATGKPGSEGGGQRS